MTKDDLWLAYFSVEAAPEGDKAELLWGASTNTDCVGIGVALSNVSLLPHLCALAYMRGSERLSEECTDVRPQE